LKNEINPVAMLRIGYDINCSGEGTAKSFKRNDDRRETACLPVSMDLL